jgi:tetratricopeptide (TPR) repeat protein
MNDNLETIEAYLNGTMTAEERRLFEEKMKSDPELEETCRMYLAIQSTMSKPTTAKGEEELKDTLRTVRANYAGAPPTGRRIVFRAWHAVAALFIVAVGAGLFFFLQKPDAGALYKKYAQHAEISIDTRSGANDRLGLSAARAYNAGNFSRAADLLNRYNTREPGVAEMQLAEGVSYLELDRYAEAERLFETVARGQTVFAGHAQWYLGLLYLKQRKFDECRKALEAIPADASFYEKAQSLLKELP